MRLSNFQREELVREVFARTEKAAEGEALRKRLRAAAQEFAVNWRAANHPEFVAALEKAPKIIVEQLTYDEHISKRIESKELHFLAFSELFGAADKSFRSQIYIRLDIGNLKMPLHNNVDDSAFVIPEEIIAEAVAWHEKYTKAENALRSILWQCTSAAQLEKALPDVAKLLPREIKQLPAIRPEKAADALTAIGFPPSKHPEVCDA